MSTIPLCKLKDNNKKLLFELEYKNRVQNTIFNYYNAENDNYMINEYYKYLNITDTNIPSWDNLHNLISSTYKHAKRRINLFPIIDRQSDGRLLCIYSNELIETNECKRLIKCNEEHALPQSWHARLKNKIGSDMHQIFCCGTSANSFRKNHPFGTFNKEYLKRQSKAGYIYTNDNGLSVFEPKYNTGIIARAILYVILTYPNQLHENRFPKECIPWLIHTAKTEKVTLWEKHRNYTLHQLQNNRNPFIDFPHLVDYYNFEEYAHYHGPILSKSEKKIENLRKRELRVQQRKDKKQLRKNKRNMKKKVNKIEDNYIENMDI